MGENESENSTQQIFEINSKDDLTKLSGVRVLKYVHIKGDQEDGHVYVGSQKEVDHWQLVPGKSKQEAEETIVFNAGLIYWNGEKGVLVASSGGLKGEYGDFSRMQTYFKDKKIELDEETARVLNEKCAGNYFSARNKT